MSISISRQPSDSHSSSTGSNLDGIHRFNERVKNTALDCMRQYWPAFLQAGTLVGLAIGEYGLQNGFVTAGVSGLALIVSTVASWYMKPDERTIDVQVIKDYQEAQKENRQKLSSARKMLETISNLVEDSKRIAADGQKSTAENAELINIGRLALEGMQKLAEDTHSDVGDIVATETELGLNMRRLNEEERQAVLELRDFNQRLEDGLSGSGGLKEKLEALNVDFDEKSSDESGIDLEAGKVGKESHRPESKSQCIIN